MKVSNELLSELRPKVAPLDPEWSNETLTRVLASTPTPGPARTARPRRRHIAAVGVAVVASFGGITVASASGLMPQAFTDEFAMWKDWPGRSTDPATAKRAATAPGPNGLVFSVMSTANGQADSCRTSVLETAESAKLPGPADFTAIFDNFCSDEPSLPDFGGVSVNFHADSANGYVVSAGEAVRAVVTTPDGQEYPALLVEGDFWGWFPFGERPTLTAYAADGSIVGSVNL